MLMPRVRDSTHPMTRLLRGYSINGNNLAATIKSSPATARKKIEKPEYLTVGDLIAIHRKFGIPMDDLRGAICA